MAGSTIDVEAEELSDAAIVGALVAGGAPGGEGPGGPGQRLEHHASAAV